MEDGSPLRGNIKDISIVINGVSDAAEKVSYTPVVKADGTYSQKVAGGQYRFSTAKIVVLFKNEMELQLPLEPVGRNWDKNQDAADGIVQDYVWKPTGPTPYGISSGLDKHNATHWYGATVGMTWQTYDSEKSTSATPPPEGTVLAFTCNPVSIAVDGSKPEPRTIELKFEPAKIYPNDDLVDLLTADYDITGIAKLPDGTSKPIAFQGPGDYPKYVNVLKLRMVKDTTMNGVAKLLCGFVVR